MFFDKQAVCNQTDTIACLIAFFKGTQQLAGEIRTEIAIGELSACGTVFYFAVAAVLWLAMVAVQTSGTRFFVVAVLVTYGAIHAARGKHCIV